MLQEIKRGLLGPVLRARNTRGRSLSAESIEMNAARALVTGDEEGRDEARQQAAQALANARGIPVEEANEQIAQIERRYQQAVDRVQQRATEAADAAASGVSTGAILAFVALVLGAIAGWLGGRSGVVHPVYADRVIPTRRRG